MSDFHTITLPAKVAQKVKDRPFFPLMHVMREISRRTGLSLSEIFPKPYTSDQIGPEPMICVSNALVKVNGRPSLNPDGTGVQPHTLQMSGKTFSDAAVSYMQRLGDESVFVFVGLGGPDHPQAVFKVKPEFGLRS